MIDAAAEKSEENRSDDQQQRLDIFSGMERLIDLEGDGDQGSRADAQRAKVPLPVRSNQ